MCDTFSASKACCPYRRCSIVRDFFFLSRVPALCMKACTAAVEYILSLSSIALIQILVREKIFYISNVISSISGNFKKARNSIFSCLVFSF